MTELRNRLLNVATTREDMEWLAEKAVENILKDESDYDQVDWGTCGSPLCFVGHCQYILKSDFTGRRDIMFGFTKLSDLEHADISDASPEIGNSGWISEEAKKLYVRGSKSDRVSALLTELKETYSINLFHMIK